MSKIYSTVSCRAKPENISMEYWLHQYGNIDITSIYGFVKEYTPLYGGRVFGSADITEKDLNWMYDNNINLKLPLSNIFVDEKDYLYSKQFLEKYHKDGNIVAITDDKLLEWIKNDFPKYKVEASVIKNTKFNQIDKTLEKYDSVVLAAGMNDALEDLMKIKQKDKIVLFANAGCAYNCPSKICYPSVSKINKGMDQEYRCSQPIVERPPISIIKFNIPLLRQMGFRNFKYVTEGKSFGY